MSRSTIGGYLLPFDAAPYRRPERLPARILEDLAAKVRADVVTAVALVAQLADHPEDRQYIVLAAVCATIGAAVAERQIADGVRDHRITETQLEGFVKDVCANMAEAIRRRDASERTPT